MTQRAFVTGANGFVGRSLSLRLRTLGWQVSGVDLVADPAHNIQGGDINTAGPWMTEAAAADAIFHTAAVVSNIADSDTAWRVNVLGTKKVIDATAPGAVFVHLSSVRAFSDLDFPDMVTEEHPVRTDGNAYVDTKVASEQVVLQAHGAGRIDARIARPRRYLRAGIAALDNPAGGDDPQSPVRVARDGARSLFADLYR